MKDNDTNGRGGFWKAYDESHSLFNVDLTCDGVDSAGLKAFIHGLRYELMKVMADEYDKMCKESFAFLERRDATREYKDGYEDATLELEFFIKRFWV